jgi:hypothetical protein
MFESAVLQVFEEILYNVLLLSSFCSVQVMEEILYHISMYNRVLIISTLAINSLHQEGAYSISFHSL